METIAHGRRGKIVRFKNTKGDLIGRKIAHNQEKKGAIQKEAEILTYLQKQGIKFVPKIIDKEESSFDYYWIEGEHFENIWRNVGKEKRKKLIEKLLKCGYQLDKVGVTHGELSQPTKNVLVTPEGSVAILDFERGTRTKNGPINLRHLAQRLLREGYITKNIVQKIGSIKKPKLAYQYLNKHLNSTKQAISFRNSGLLITVLIFIGLDLFTKRLFYNQRFGEEFSLLTPVFNKGIGWSIPIPVFWTIGLSILIIIALYFLINKNDKLERWLLAFIGGGAIGNLIDRVFYHGVRDFIDLGFRPVFNLADIWITIGGILLVYKILFHKDKERPRLLNQS